MWIDGRKEFVDYTKVNKLETIRTNQGFLTRITNMSIQNIT